MIKYKQTISPIILQQATDIIQKHFTKSIKINATDFLSEPERRNVVLRFRLENSSNSSPKSIVLKQSLPEESSEDDKDAYARFARDWAGLEFASTLQNRAHFVPRFYGGNKESRFILIEDLGLLHVSLVDSLTHPNHDKAIAALGRFMKALGSFHAASFGYTASYETILKGIHEKADTLVEDLDFTLADLLSKLESANAKLGLSLTDECIEEAKSLIESLLKPGPFTVLTHGDICPDNVFDHENARDLQLIDFEWACVRNALLDGTYLRMSMPTCWCAKSIPEHIIEPLEHIYREELKRTIPAARDFQTYTTAYTEACGFWLLQQTLPFLDSTMDNDRLGPSGPTPENSLWNPKENWVRPRVISRLQAFVDVATKYQSLPNLKQMAACMLTIAKERWPDVKPLELYPAFRLSTGHHHA